MASPEVLDLASILKPISPEEPAGKNLRADSSPQSVYYRIKEARTAARTAERTAETDDANRQDNFVPPEWKIVLDLGPQILSGKSKDLEVTAWLIEALTRHHGAAGLRDGFRAAHGLVEGFWDGLWPRPDEDGLVTRVSPLIGLNGEDSTGTLITPIAKIPITNGRTHGPLATWHFQKANEVNRIEDLDRRQAQFAAGVHSLEAFQKAVGETPVPYYQNLTEDLRQCLEEYAKLCAALDGRCGSDAPPSSQIRVALESVLETVSLVARDKLAASSPEAGGGGAVADDGNHRPGSGPLRTREDAFASLARVAEYFRTTEPHSPLSYLLDQAVRWGRLPLPELLDELIPDDSARGMYKRLTGIKSQKSE